MKVSKVREVNTCTQSNRSTISRMSFTRKLSPAECKPFVVRSILQLVTITPQKLQANSHDLGIMQTIKNALNCIIQRLASTCYVFH